MLPLGHSKLTWKQAHDEIFHLSHILINDDVGFGGPKMHSRMKVAFLVLLKLRRGIYINI